MSNVAIGPLERFGVSIVGADVTHDLSFEVILRGEDAAGDQVALDLGEPDFDLVEPGGVGRGVVNGDVWMLAQKSGAALGFMGGKVVDDEVDFLALPLAWRRLGRGRRQTLRWCDGMPSCQ